MKVPLWPKQQQIIGDVRGAFRTYESVCLQSATGSGKTHMGTAAAKSATEKGHNIIWLAHRRELLEGTSNTFTKYGVHHSVMMGGSHHNQHLRATLASVGTLVNRIEKTRPPKLLIVDEAHHAPSKSFDTIIRWVIAEGGKVLGLTATPWRLSGEGLDTHFQHMVQGPPVAWLIENGYLSDYRAYAPATPDLTGVHTRMGDYVKSEIDQVMQGKAILSGCVQHYRQLANGKRMIGFAVSVQHSQMLVDEFNRAGIPAAHVDANTPKHYRKQHILNFATGHTKVLFCVDLFSEGFDLSAVAGRDVTIEGVIQARPTKSLSLHLQQLGRALRRKPYPAILIDLCGNLARLGLPDHPHEWTLAGRPKKGRSSDSEQNELTRKCKGCDVMYAISLLACPHCGTVPESGGAGRTVDEVDGQLHEVDREAARRAALREQGQAQTLEELVDLGKKKEYKNPLKWACHIRISRAQKKGVQWESQLLDELVEYAKKENYRNPQSWASHLLTSLMQNKNRAG